MILFVWMAAGIISLAPVLGWKDEEFESRITNDNECLISQDVGYQVFATCTTFYFPLTLTLIFYWKIYQVSKGQHCLLVYFGLCLDLTLCFLSSIIRYIYGILTSYYGQMNSFSLYFWSLCDIFFRR